MITNSGTVAATSLSFSVPIVTNKASYISGSNTFIITSKTCGSTLVAGASCMVDIEWFTCNDQCLVVVPTVCNGVVEVSADGGIKASLTPLYYNCGGI